MLIAGVVYGAELNFITIIKNVIWLDVCGGCEHSHGLNKIKSHKIDVKMPKNAIVKAPWQLFRKLISHRILSMNQLEEEEIFANGEARGKGVEKWNFARPSVGQLTLTQPAATDRQI